MGNLVWPSCGSSVPRRDMSKNAQNTASDTDSSPITDPDPPPTHVYFGENQAFFFVKKLFDHTNSHIMKYSPISILHPR